jgi:hypothetical protein
MKWMLLTNLPDTLFLMRPLRLTHTFIYLDKNDIYGYSLNILIVVRAMFRKLH